MNKLWQQLAIATNWPVLAAVGVLTSLGCMSIWADSRADGIKQWAISNRAMIEPVKRVFDSMITGIDSDPVLSKLVSSLVDFAHSIDAAAIAKTLHSERFDTVLGTVGFDAKGDITAQGYVLYVWRDGNFTPAKGN